MEDETMEYNGHRDCHWYHTSRDMSAIIISCAFYNDLYSCRCNEYDGEGEYECEAYLNENEADAILRDYIRTKNFPK